MRHTEHREAPPPPPRYAAGTRGAGEIAEALLGAGVLGLLGTGCIALDRCEVSPWVAAELVFFGLALWICLSAAMTTLNRRGAR